MATFRDLLKRTVRDIDHRALAGDPLLDDLLLRGLERARRRSQGRSRRQTALARPRLRTTPKPIDLPRLVTPAPGLGDGLARPGDDPRDAGFWKCPCARSTEPPMGISFEDLVARSGEYTKSVINYGIDVRADAQHRLAQLTPLAEHEFATRDDLATLADRVRDLETAHVLRGRR